MTKVSSSYFLEFIGDHIKRINRIIIRCGALILLICLMTAPFSGRCEAAQVTLAWDASTDPAVVGYKLYGGLASRVYTVSAPVGNILQYPITGIPEGLPIYFAVTAYDAQGNESAFSSELVCYTLIPFAGDNGTLNPESAVVVSAGMSKTFTVSPAAGYSILDVLIDGVSVGAVGSYTFSNVSACHYIYAGFFDGAASTTGNFYTISASSSSGGTINPAGNISVGQGGNQTFTIAPDSRKYQIASVIVDGVSVGAVNSYTFSDLAANHTITANFTFSAWYSRIYNRIIQHSAKSAIATSNGTVSEAIATTTDSKDALLSANPMSGAQTIEGNSRLLPANASGCVLAGASSSITMLTPQGDTILPPFHIDWPDYNQLGGELRVAAGNLDGTGLGKIVVGLGPVNGPSGIPGGYFAVLDGNFNVISWGQVQWPEYNEMNGETRPACGDIDGDGNDEIIIGLGPGGEGRLEVFKFEDNQLKHLKWLQTGWQEYIRGNGETRPACGDLNGDGMDELVVGLGPISGNLEIPGGVFLIFDQTSTGSLQLRDSSESDVAAWGRVESGDYDRVNGEIWPACGDVNDDGKDEIILGLGKEAEGFFEIVAFDLSENRMQHLAWRQSALANAVHPACGVLDSGGVEQIVLASGSGMLEIFGNAKEDYQSLSQIQSPVDTTSDGSEYVLWPAVLVRADE